MSNVLKDQETIEPEKKSDRKALVITIILWVVQVALAAQLLMAGGIKLTGTDEILLQFYPGMPAIFMRFIAVCEVLGALGIIFPGMIRRLRWLTPLAAIGSLIIMIGAVVYTIVSVGLGWIWSPLIVTILCAIVVLGRWTWFRRDNR